MDSITYLHAFYIRKKKKSQSLRERKTLLDTHFHTPNLPGRKKKDGCKDFSWKPPVVGNGNGTCYKGDGVS